MEDLIRSASRREIFCSTSLLTSASTSDSRETGLSAAVEDVGAFISFSVSRFGIVSFLTRTIFQVGLTTVYYDSFAKQCRRRTRLWANAYLASPVRSRVQHWLAGALGPSGGSFSLGVGGSYLRRLPDVTVHGRSHRRSGQSPSQQPIQGQHL